MLFNDYIISNEKMYFKIQGLSLQKTTVNSLKILMQLFPLIYLKMKRVFLMGGDLKFQLELE